MAWMIRSHHSCVPSGEKTAKPKWRQPYHGHLTLNATPFWSNMCFVLALMDLRFQGFWVYWFILHTLSSEGYCWPGLRCSVQMRLILILWMVWLFLNVASFDFQVFFSKILPLLDGLGWISVFACVRVWPLANYLICQSCCTIFLLIKIWCWVLSFLQRIQVSQKNPRDKY